LLNSTVRTHIIRLFAKKKYRKIYIKTVLFKMFSNINKLWFNKMICQSIIKVWSTFSKVVGVGKAHKYFPFLQSDDSQTINYPNFWQKQYKQKSRSEQAAFYRLYFLIKFTSAFRAVNSVFTFYISYSKLCLADRAL